MACLRCTGKPRPASPAQQTQYVRDPVKPDTRKLLITGGIIFGIAAVAALLALTVFGGIGPQGPHSNGGWLMLMLFMGCAPTGLLTLLLALAKVSADRRK